MNKPNGNTFITDEFDKFKLIDSNRNDWELRAKNIAKSVKKVNYIPAPIIVNEKYEIIDGQARFTYCKQTKTPITYLVIKGLTVDDCVAMNASTTRWVISDYIESYAQRGWNDYVILNEFLKAAKSKGYGYKESVWTLTLSEGSNSDDKIKNGEFVLKSGAVKRAEEIMVYWDKFKDIPTNRKKDFYKALGYCYLLECVDNERLVRKVHQFPRRFLNIANVNGMMDILEEIYNYRNRKDEHTYLKTEYFKYLNNINGNITTMILNKQVKNHNV